MASDQKKPEWQQIMDAERDKMAAKTKRLREARLAAEAAAPPVTKASKPAPRKAAVNRIKPGQ